MAWFRPDFSTVLKAIDAYLKVAYAGVSPPTAVRGRLDTLRASESNLYESPAWERDVASPPARYALRLGNITYPHMKLVIEPAPDGVGYLMRADTHDKHITVPLGSREHAAFAQLMKRNHEIATAIESAWNAAGIPTFKEFLRKDLARRAQAASANP
jgi:hypothetical protein